MSRTSDRLNSEELDVRAQGYVRLTFGYDSTESHMFHRAVQQLGPRDYRVVPDVKGRLSIWVKPSNHQQHLTHAVPDAVRAELWAR